MKWISRATLIVAVVLLLAAGCMNIFEADVSPDDVSSPGDALTGSLSLVPRTEADGVSASFLYELSTIRPGEDAFTIDSYVLSTLDNPDGAQARSEEIAGEATGFTLDALEKGEWQFEIGGYPDAEAEQPITEATVTVTIEAGETTEASVVMEPADGEGTLALEVIWSEPAELELDPDEPFTVTLDGTPVTSDFVLDEEQLVASYEAPHPAGSYTLLVDLWNSDNERLAPTQRAAVRMYAGLSSSGVIEFSEAMLNERPPQPANVSAEVSYGGTDGSYEVEGVEIEWDMPQQSFAIDYLVERSGDGGDSYVLLAHLDVNDPDFEPAHLDETVEPGQTYQYRVSGVSAIGRQSEREESAPVEVVAPIDATASGSVFDTVIEAFVEGATIQGFHEETLLFETTSDVDGQFLSTFNFLPDMIGDNITIEATADGSSTDSLSVPLDEPEELENIELEIEGLHSGNLLAFEESDFTNSTTWAAGADPGSIAWEPFPGAEDYDIYLSNSEDDIESLDSAALEASGVTDTSYALNDLTPGDWFYNVVGLNQYGEVASPDIGQITVRDALYVSDSEGNGAAAGSTGEPFDSVVEALVIAEPSETIRVAEGTYESAGILISEGVTIEGSYDAAFGAKGEGEPTTTLINSDQSATNTVSVSVSGADPVTLDGISVRFPDHGTPEPEMSAVEFGAGTLNLVNSRIEFQDGVESSGDGVAGIILTGENQTLNVENSSFISSGRVDGADAHSIFLGGAADAEITVADSQFQADGLDAQGWTAVGMAVGGLEDEHDNTLFHFVDNQVTLPAGEEVLFNGISLAYALGEIAIHGNVFDLDGTNTGNQTAITVVSPPDQTGWNRPMVTANRIRVRGSDSGTESYGVLISDDADSSLGALVSNNVIELFGSGGTPDYGILAEAAHSSIINNTVVFANDYEGTADSSLLSLSGGAADSVVANNILSNQDPAEEVTGISLPEGLPDNTSVVTNVLFGFAALTALNEESQAAGNFSMDPDLDETAWYEPTVGTPDFVLVAGVDSFLDDVDSDIDGTTRSFNHVSPGAYQTDDGTIDEYGHIGPAGGFVFYRNPNYEADGWVFLEALDSDVGEDDQYPWSDPVVEVEGTSANIGTGPANTDLILAALLGQDQTQDRAAIVADESSLNGYDDWFLPSEDALLEMYDNLAEDDTEGTYGLETGHYWSSTEVNSESAISVSMGNRIVGMSEKSINRRVRPARLF